MSFSRKQFLVYIALGVVVLAVGARFLLADRSGAGGRRSDGLVLSAPSPQAASASPSASAPSQIVVDVCGAVARPGVYTLPPDARVCDAVDLAGGATADAELSAVNLAARVADGQQIAVPRKGAAGSAGQAGGGAATAGGGQDGDASAGGAAAPLDLNTATLEQLDALSGIGPATAQKIIAFRDTNGGFASVEQLLDVPGIGEVKFAALKDLVTV